MSEEEIKVAYIHVPIFYNARTIQKEENKIVNKRDLTNEEFLIVEGTLLIIIVVSSVILWFLNKLWRD